MPFHIPSARIAQASPSISLEKGSYRMRAPPARTPLSRSRLHAQAQSSKPRARARANGGPANANANVNANEFLPASYERRMVLLVLLLACAAMASFGAAYYLWTTSAKTHVVRPSR